jgi:hypothetical protein
MTQCQVCCRLEGVAIKQSDGEAREIAVKNNELPAWSEHTAGFGQHPLWIDQMRVDRVRDHKIEEGVRLSACYGIAEFERYSRLTCECFVRHTYEHGRWVDPYESRWIEMLHDHLRCRAVAASHFENPISSHGDLPHITGADRLHRQLGCRMFIDLAMASNTSRGCSSMRVSRSVTATSHVDSIQDEKDTLREARPGADRHDGADTAGC